MTTNIVQLAYKSRVCPVYFLIQTSFTLKLHGSAAFVHPNRIDTPHSGVPMSYGNNSRVEQERRTEEPDWTSNVYIPRVVPLLEVVYGLIP